MRAEGVLLLLPLQLPYARYAYDGQLCSCLLCYAYYVQLRQQEACAEGVPFTVTTHYIEQGSQTLCLRMDRAGLHGY